MSTSKSVNMHIIRVSISDSSGIINFILHTRQTLSRIYTQQVYNTLTNILTIWPRQWSSRRWRACRTGGQGRTGRRDGPALLGSDCVYVGRGSGGGVVCVTYGEYSVYTVYKLTWYLRLTLSPHSYVYKHIHGYIQYICISAHLIHKIYTSIRTKK